MLPKAFAAIDSRSMLPPAIRPLYIHAYGQTAVPTGDWPSFDLNDLVFRSPLPSDGAPDKEAREQLNRVAGEIVKLAVASGSTTIVVRSGRRICTGGVYLALVLRRLLSSTSFVLSDESLSINASLTTLKRGVFDFVVRESDPSKLSALLPGLVDPATITAAKVFWMGDDDLFAWNRASTANPDTLLVILPAWNNEFAPFGIAHISSALKSAGFGVDVLDLNCPFWAKMKSRMEDCAQFENYMMWSTPDRYVSSCRPHLDETFQALTHAVRSGRYKYVGFSVFETNRLPTEEACRLIREIDPAIKLFAGGPSCTPMWSKAMLAKADGLDGAVLGEGELTAIDLLSAWRDGSDRQIPGGSRRSDDGRVVSGGSRPLADMKTLPLPDFDGLPIYNYEKFMLPIFFSRGCVAKCTFCAETQYWKKFRLLPVERVLDTIGHAVREYGIRSFQVNDSLMNGSHPLLEQICDGIIERGYDVHFTGYCRL
ncbi:MAG: cobalamin-dependent protein, partial [Bdellovibrionota bacterium]